MHIDVVVINSVIHFVEYDRHASCMGRVDLASEFERGYVEVSASDPCRSVFDEWHLPTLTFRSFLLNENLVIRMLSVKYSKLPIQFVIKIKVCDSIFPLFMIKCGW